MIPLSFVLIPRKELSAMKIRRAILLAALLVWFAAIAQGMHLLNRYVSTAGESTIFSTEWPKQTSLQLTKNSFPTLVVFLHPECPCSRATVEEFDRLMAQTEGRANVFAVFFQPPGWNERRVKSSLWHRTGKIPGIKRVIDSQGQETKRFGVSTSGHAFLFYPSGRLAFSGGITSGRGHAGDNLGVRTVTELMSSGEIIGNKIERTDVFGCALEMRAQL
jgi:hypothetical protein